MLTSIFFVVFTKSKYYVKLNLVGDDMLSSIEINYLSYRVVPLVQKNNSIIIKAEKYNVKPVTKISSNVNYNSKEKGNSYYNERQNNKQKNIFDEYLKNNIDDYDKGNHFDKYI